MLKTSIIIPIIEDLGVEENLSMFNKALDSLNNQELLPDEIIVVSNKDNSKYIKKHKNVVFVQSLTIRRHWPMLLSNLSIIRASLTSLEKTHEIII